MSRPIALLVEDEPVAAAELSNWLHEAGWAVDVCRSGAEALKRATDAPPSLVIAELMLPGLDGPALCANLRIRPYGDRLALVLMSSRSDARPAAIAAGANALLLRPFRKDEFLATISSAVGSAPSATTAFVEEALRPVRVPSTSRKEPEEGELGTGVFLHLLRRFLEERLDGVLEVDGSEGFRAKLYFSRGSPAAARCSDPGTSFGNLLLKLGFVTSETLSACLDEGRRTGAALGEVLLRSDLIERRAVEHTLRAQVLLRAVAIGTLTSGRYTLDPAEPIGLAGFDVPSGVVAWHLGDSPAELSEAQLSQHLRVLPDVFVIWPLVDPDNSLGVLRALLVGGATPADCARVCGERAAALVRVLYAWKLASLSDEAPSVASRDAGLAELDAGNLADALISEHRSLLDADLYTVLGLQPDADPDEVVAAATAGLTRRHSNALPSTLDPASRERARAIYDRILEAGRVLSNPARRAIYDARLGGTAAAGRRESPGTEDHAVLQAERARDLFRHGEYVAAAAVFNIAIQLEGEAPDILAMLGWARHRACPEDPAAGEAELRRALALDPTDEFALTYLGRLLADRGDVDAARACLREALHKNHEFGPARDALQKLI